MEILSQSITLCAQREKNSVIKHILAIVAILCILVLSGCSHHPGGFSAPRGLSSSEKQIITRIGTEEVEIPPHANPSVELTWAAIVWQGSQKKEIHYLRTDVPLIEALDKIPASASWYPAAIVSTGANEFMTWVAIDLPTQEVVDIYSQTHPTIP